MSRSRWLTLAALAVAPLAAACQTPPAPSASAPVGEGAAGGTAPTVVVIGDSISQAAATEIEAAFHRRGVRVSVPAHTNDLFRDRQQAAGEAAAGRPEVVVVNLGTNDVRCAAANASGTDPCRYPDVTDADLAPDADRLVAAFAPGTCVIGVDPTAAPTVGALWAERAASGAVAGVAGWRAEAAGHPGWVADPAGHLSAEGRTAYAAFLDAEVARVCDGAST